MTAFERMIHCTYPNAIPGKDFTLMTGEDGNPVIDYWNKEKLGVEPSICAIHASYMRWAKKKKELLPTFDDSDPAPWLNKNFEDVAEKQPETAEYSTKHQNSNSSTCVYPNGVIARRIK